MRRALVLAIATLAAALLAIALACGSNPIFIATIDAGAGHIKCEVGDASDGGEIDPTAPFCSTTTTTCGSKDGFYESVDSPDCGASGPECGCDGISYYTRCVRQQAHMSLAVTGPCPPIRGESPGSITAIGCQDPGCKPRHPGCSFISALSVAQLSLYPGFSDGLAMFCQGAKMVLAGREAGTLFPNMFPNTNDAGIAGPGACWALPDSCPASGSPRVHGPCERSCDIDECKAIAMRSVGPYFPCEPDGADAF